MTTTPATAPATTPAARTYTDPADIIRQAGGKPGETSSLGGVLFNQGMFPSTALITAQIYPTNDARTKALTDAVNEPGSNAYAGVSGAVQHFYIAGPRYYVFLSSAIGYGHGEGPDAQTVAKRIGRTVYQPPTNGGPCNPDYNQDLTGRPCQPDEPKAQASIPPGYVACGVTGAVAPDTNHNGVCDPADGSTPAPTTIPPFPPTTATPAAPQGNPPPGYVRCGNRSGDWALDRNHNGRCDPSD